MQYHNHILIGEQQSKAWWLDVSLTWSFDLDRQAQSCIHFFSDEYVTGEPLHTKIEFVSEWNIEQWLVESIYPFDSYQCTVSCETVPNLTCRYAEGAVLTQATKQETQDDRFDLDINNLATRNIKR